MDDVGRPEREGDPLTEGKAQLVCRLEGRHAVGGRIADAPPELFTGHLDRARIRRLAPRWFVARDAHAGDGPVLLQPRWALSYLRAPMTRSELRGAIEARRARRGTTD